MGTTARELTIIHPAHTVITGTTNRILVSDAEFEEYAQALRSYTDNTIDEGTWRCPYFQGTKTIPISFTKLEITEQELRVVKVYVINSLARGNAPTTCAAHVRNLAVLFDYCREKKICIEQFSTALAYRFRDWLDYNMAAQSMEKRNSIEAAAASFVRFLQTKHLPPPTPVEFPRQRKSHRQPKRAPEMVVMKKIDRYMFDFSTPVGCDIRCAYILHRILPSRSSELLTAGINCLHTDDELFTVELPTQKETAYHRAQQRTFSFFSSGTLESSLLRALQAQRSYALEMQPLVNPRHKGFLMVSVKHPQRLLTTGDFNREMREICGKLNVIDSLGEPAYITSHDLRHVSVGEALREGVPIEEIQDRCGHRTESMTMSYGYPARADERRILAKTAEQAHAALSAGRSETIQTETKALPLLPGRFKKMRGRDPWLLGDDCLCAQQTCRPQWEHCIMECEDFQPDARFLTMAELICAELLTHGENLSEHQKRQYAIWTRFIERVKECDCIGQTSR